MRKRAVVMLIAASLSVVAVGTTIAWSNNAGSAGSQSPAANVEQSFTDATSAAGPAEERSFLTGINVDEAYGDLLAKWARSDNPKTLTSADFNQAFVDASKLSRDNTPTNREKLRNAGWSRISESH
jgi:hypothetical protein